MGRRPAHPPPAGALRGIVERHLRDCRDRGELASGLGASESTIYGRFGYGISTFRARYEIDRHRAAFRRPVEVPGGFQLLDRDEARVLFPPVYDHIQPQVPGEVSRPPGFWDAYFVDLDWDAEEDRPWFHLLHRDEDGEPDVPALLAERHYSRQGEVVLEVVDDLAGGRFHLEVTADGVACEPTSRDPDLTLGPSELGSAVLGGVSVVDLHRAGRVDQHRGRGRRWRGRPLRQQAAALHLNPLLATAGVMATGPRGRVGDCGRGRPGGTRGVASEDVRVGVRGGLPRGGDRRVHRDGVQRVRRARR